MNSGGLLIGFSEVTAYEIHNLRVLRFLGRAADRTTVLRLRGRREQGGSMTREKQLARAKAFAVLECMAIDLTGALAESSKTSPMTEVLEERLEAIDTAQAALREQPRWISVEERLPEEWKSTSGDFINYMVFMPEYGVDIGNYLQPANGWMCMGIPADVTHWMPLPEPPKEEV